MLLFASSYASANIIERELQRLDNALVESETYDKQRLDKIEQLNDLLQMRGISLEYKYEVYNQLYQ